jgi:hypothetical protein
VADLDHEQSVFVQVRRRARDDALHEVEAIRASRERESGLAAIFRRQSAHRRIPYVRRVRHDHVVSPRVQSGVEVRADEPHAFFQTVVGDVAARHGERIARNIAGGDARLPEGERGEDRETARTGAQIERGAHARQRPRREIVPQKLRDVRARNDDALVDVKPVLAEPCLVREVSRRLACTNAFIDEAVDASRVVRGEAAFEMRRGIVGRQSQRMEDEPRGFVARVRRAVTVGNLRGFKPPGGRVQRRA